MNFFLFLVLVVNHVLLLYNFLIFLTFYFFIIILPLFVNEFYSQFDIHSLMLTD
jgi:hypothetical protein